MPIWFQPHTDIVLNCSIFFRSCKILFGLVKFKTAPDRMSGNVWEVFVNTELSLASTRLSYLLDAVQSDLCGTWLKTPKKNFLAMRHT